jgi:DNA-directed RNA polymerase subunit RPC12/RpoP
MQEQTLDGRLGRPVSIDICHPCQSFWFDTHESLSLTPGATLQLFKVIGEHATRPQRTNADLSKCPRCKAHLRRTHDMQRTTKFEYLNCPNGHGRLTTFFDFLREKDFIRPLTTQQIADLRRNVQTVNCANCGAPVDLATGAACAHCGTALSMLDMAQAERLMAQLQKADARERQPIDPSLPIELARARRDTELAFAQLEGGDQWYKDVTSTDLIGAGLKAVFRLLK